MPKCEPNTEDQIVTTYELLEQSARAALDLQREDGSFPSSRNDIYDEPETPVRTTSKWLVTLVGVYDITGNPIFAEGANKAADYLLSDETRPFGYTFHSRNAAGKDKCDGLVGQASPIRGLTRAGQILDRPALVETALSVFLLHPFDEHIGLWERVEITGNPLSFDRTLNHQIFFAAAGAELVNESEIVQNQINIFLDSLKDNLQTREDGRIEHYIRPPKIKIFKHIVRQPRHWNLVWNEIISRYYVRNEKRKRKELGYHPNVLSGLSMIRRRIPHHDIWNHQSIDTAISFFEKEEYIQQLEKDNLKFGSALPGIDRARVAVAFDRGDKKSLQDWVSKDLAEKYDPKTNMLTKNAADSTFQATAIKNLLDIPNLEIHSSRIHC